MKALLTIEGVSHTYHTADGEILAVKDLNFSVWDGEFVAVIGPSGCGKTTVLSIMSGLLKPTKGRVSLKGNSPDKNLGQSGYMLQKDQLFPWRKVIANVMLPLEIKGLKSHKNEQFACELLAKYGLEEFKNHYPDQLSGGMRQRVALIRTLASMPKLLLLDEPFSALDYQTRLTVCDDVYGIIKSEKKTAVLVTHDISEAVSVADRIIMLTKRPARVKNVYTLEFIGANSPLERREHPDFRVWFERLWRDINDEN